MVQGSGHLRDGVPVRFQSMGHSSRQAFEFSSKEVVLGLVIERPDNAYRVGQRLDRVLRDARYGRGTAEKALKNLAEEGLIRRVGEGDAQEAGGVYEATPAGVEYFRAWLRASTPMPPVREELHAKIALCDPSDLPLMIAAVRETQLACLAELDAVNRRTRSERKVVGEREWKRRMGVVVTAGNAAWWEGRLKWLQQVHTYLQDEWKHYQAEQISSRSG